MLQNRNKILTLLSVFSLKKKTFFSLEMAKMILKTFFSENVS